MQIFFVENIKIMSKSEAYKKQEPIKQTVNEPVTEYRSPSTMGEMELLSDEIIIGAVKYAQIAREKGRMIPNSEVYGLLADRLGWKYCLNMERLDALFISKTIFIIRFMRIELK